MQSVNDLQSVVKLTISHHSSIYEIVFLNYWYVLIPLIQVDISMIVLKSFSKFWTQNTRPSEWSWQDTIYLFWLGDIFNLSRMVQFSWHLFRCFSLCSECSDKGKRPRPGLNCYWPGWRRRWRGWPQHRGGKRLCNIIILFLSSD